MNILRTLIRMSLFWSVQTQYRPWSPPDTDFAGLMCPDRCFNGNETDISCCYCECKADWEIGITNRPTLLKVEYNDVTGNYATLIAPKGNLSGLMEIEHTFGRLRQIPANICDFVKLVRMDFNNNELQKIRNISCLMYIEIIDLGNNMITYIDNETFTLLPKLRNLILDHNPIQTIDPNSFQGHGRSIFNIDISYAKLKSIDYTNMFFENHFCELSFEGNTELSSFENALNFEIDETKVYGEGGYVSFSNCNLKTFINVSDFGLQEWKSFGKYVKLELNTTNAVMNCGCQMRSLLENSAESVRLWSDKQLLNYTCEVPEGLKGANLLNMILSNNFTGMICDIKEDCPKECHCYSTTTDLQLVVDCSNKSLTKLPDKLPWAKNYTLLFAGNNIQTVDYRSYMNKVGYVDLNNNNIATITKDSVKSLPKDVEVLITGNALNNIPLALVDKSPEKIIMGDIYVNCKCDDKWIPVWQRRDGATNTTSNIYCTNINNQNILLADISSLCPYHDIWSSLSIGLSCIAALLMGGFLIFICFKPEIFIMYRNRLKCRKRKSKVIYHNDVYISFDEENADLRKWIRLILAPYLEQLGYRLFIPIRDIVPGDDFMRARLNAMDSSRSYIVVLSENTFHKNTAPPDLNSEYVDQYDSTVHFEFSHIWYNFKTDPSKRVAVVNFDNIDSTKANNRYMQAFIRVREAIDITNRFEDILKAIENKLAPPQTELERALHLQIERKCDINARTTFKKIHKDTLM